MVGLNQCIAFALNFDPCDDSLYHLSGDLIPTLLDDLNDPLSLNDFSIGTPCSVLTLLILAIEGIDSILSFLKELLQFDFVLLELLDLCLPHSQLHMHCAQVKHCR